MKPLFVTTIVLSILTNYLFAKSKPVNLDYILQRKDSTSLLITVSFKGNKAGKTVLHLPDDWAGQHMLYKAVSMLHALSKATFTDTTLQPDNYIVRYRPGSVVTIAYNLSQGWSGPFKYPFYSRPVIRANLFYFEGYSGLAYPDLAESHAIRCKITYQGFAKEEFKGNSFFSNQRSGTFMSSIRELRNSFFCAGNFRSKTVIRQGHQIVMAVYGKFPYADEEAFSAVSKIILEERKFWADQGPRYYFTLTMSTDDKGSNGGTAHYNSFCLFQSGDLRLAAVLQTISHEYFHNWIGSGLRNPDPDEAYKWFSEGFTDYYSLKLLHQSGGLRDTDFVKKINEDIRQYYLSPHFNSDSLEMSGKYRTDEGWRQLPYRRGLTIALTLDLKIQEKSSLLSLNDLMRELYQRSKPSMVFSASLFEKLVLKYTGQETLDAVKTSIQGRNDMLSRALLSNKIDKTSQLPVHQLFDAGFDIAASTKEKKIVGLKPGSNAEKAGLTEDMPFTGNVGYWINNMEKPMKVQILRDDKKEWITYMPVAKVNLQVPQITYKKINLY
jgi:predicted metalloprotease with PDZ domain